MLAWWCQNTNLPPYAARVNSVAQTSRIVVDAGLQYNTLWYKEREHGPVVRSRDKAGLHVNAAEPL